MKKNISVIALMLMVTLLACAQQKKTSSSISANRKGAGTYSFIKMSRTPCFGKCPAYIIELHPDGRVRYTGKSNTEYTGIYEKRMSPAKVGEVFEAFATYRVDTTQPEYQLIIPDLPGLNFEYVYNNQEREIMHAQFGPGYFKTLSQKIDDVIGKPGPGWIKVNEDGKKD